MTLQMIQSHNNTNIQLDKSSSSVFCRGEQQNNITITNERFVSYVIQTCVLIVF